MEGKQLWFAFFSLRRRSALSLWVFAPVAVADQPFKNCTAARDAGYEDIPSTSEYYGEHLDSDLDGIGCES